MTVEVASQKAYAPLLDTGVLVSGQKAYAPIIKSEVRVSLQTAYVPIYSTLTAAAPRRRMAGFVN